MSKTLLSLGLLVSFIFFSLGINQTSAAQAQSFPEEIRIIRQITSDEIGTPRPAGIAYSTTSGEFHLVRGIDEGQRLPGLLDVQQMNRFMHERGSSLIDLALADPINITFDPVSSRLLIYHSSAHSLAAVMQNAAGKLIPNSLTLYDLEHIGLQSPQGLSIDQESGDLFVLDSAANKIVRITPEQGGNFSGAGSTSIDLSTAGSQSLRGLAIDPSSGSFFVTGAEELTLYEFSRDGILLSARGLSQIGLANPQGMTFAPSGDQTDDPAVMSLYLADGGSIDTQASGGIFELSLLEAPAVTAAAFTSTLVNTVDLSTISPPSPDPTGIAFLSGAGTLLITDAEVEEEVGGITQWQETNVWELSLTGVVQSTANISTLDTDYGFTNEPAGVAFNPDNGHYYFVDDNTDRLYDLDPGGDGLIGTVDDNLVQYSTITNGSGDPEGITVDTVNQVLIVADGLNNEIYEYGLDGSLLGQFDVLKFGLENPNSVEFNPLSQTLFVLSNGFSEIIAEVTLDGELLRTIEIAEIGFLSPDGLAYSPPSSGSGDYNFYVVDRGVDNNTDPNNMDGKIFEISAPAPISSGNTPIIVNAGLDQSITLPETQVLLTGTLTDDGIPTQATTTWSQVGGACLVTFDDPASLTTNVTFPFTGRYEFRLEAFDTELNAWDTVIVDVHKVNPTQSFDAYIESGFDDAEERADGSIGRGGTSIELGEFLTSQTDGFRFNWLDIPQGAKILNAYIQFTSKAVDTDAAAFTIYGQDAGNPATFLNSLNDITGRPTTSASVAWAAEPWTTLDAQGTAQRTPDLSAILQEIVDRPDWVSGNSAVFTISGTGTRTVHGYESNPCFAAYLHVEWDSPISAGNDTYSTAEETALNVTAPGVLSNDSDPDGDPLTAVLVSGPANGSLTLNPDGSFSYTPNPDFNGDDAFTYAATNGTATSNTATVTINVTPVNDPPVADDQTLQTDEDVPLPVTLTASDVDNLVLNYILVDGPGNGSLDGTPPNVTYTPALDFNGSDSFTFKASDGSADSNIATITITVNPVNDAPVASPVSYSTDEDQPLSVALPGLQVYVTDVDSALLTFAAVDLPLNGTLNLNPNGSFTYTPDANHHGSDSFTYKANDGQLDSNTALVSITINPLNDPPVAVDDNYATNRGIPLVVNVPGVLGNDTDADLDLLTVVLSTSTTNGTLELNSNGSFTYTPNLPFFGQDTFTYHVSDGQASSGTAATVTITVADTNFPPVATDIPNQTIQEGETFLTIHLDDYVSDPDHLDADMTWSYSGNAELSVTITDRIATIGIPDPDWFGVETITFRATDPGLLFDEDAATFTVTAVNDAPIVAGIPDQMIAQGNSFTTINLDDYVSDVDNLDSELSWSYSGNSELTVSIVDRVATITAPPDWIGIETITFKATDPGDLFGEDSAVFTVTSAWRYLFLPFILR